MKKILLALTLLAAFLLPTSCDFDTNITVAARAELITPSMDIVPTQTLTFGPYTHYTLSNYEIEDIFKTLIKGSSTDFTSASLYLEYMDNITGQPLRNEEYGVVPEGNGHYSFVLMTY